MEDVKKKLISIVKNYISIDNKAKDRLIDILDINSEGLYRRIRGDVNFSFNEVAILAKEFGFSIDNIIGIKKQNGAQFKLFSPYTNNIEDIIQKSIEEKFSIFSDITNQIEYSSLRMATNTLPLALYCRHRYLSKFFLYKWKYQTQKVQPDYSFSEYTVPQNTLEDLKRYAYKTSEQKSPLTLILDQKIYASLISDIVFFYKRNLIDKETLHLLKQDLLDSLEILESYSIQGTSPGGSVIDIYLSAINLDRTYIYIGSEKHNYCEFVIYSIIPLISTDYQICKIQEDWIDSLKKYSTLITQCNEIQRHNYFSSQREIINNMIE